MWNTRKIAPIMILLCLGMNPVYGHLLPSEQPLDSFATSEQSNPNLIQPLVNPAARDQRGGRGDCTWLGC
ncbi:hypothetical protein [Roseofilum capinflatum]|uniref:Uncharacterized protein n=1 Tax=Roseofilum capinflatum BLCC-M114 TaxID=3022440 RepID=A0ABT7B374_9CYAN|nr:hypothetical protein [Roseofilum capinflatum]MDJ1173625.1 hypothetical protein [Roseofilum capinflatum BLCC-M114]